jgi:hypothetical protein
MLIVTSIVEGFGLNLIRHALTDKIQFARERHVVRLKNPAWKEVSVFWQLPPMERYWINVLAEAVIAVWTDSPLPGNAGAHRHTVRLVRALGIEFQSSTAIKLKGARQKKRLPVPRKTLPVPATTFHARTELESMARLERMRRYYDGHPQVSGILRYYKAKKINDRHDLRKEDND